MKPRVLWAIVSLVWLSTGCIQNPWAAKISAPVAAVTPAPAPVVAALGKLEPEGEVIRVSVPNAQDSRVNQLLVKEGDRVQANQVIAILQGIDRRSADLRDAQAVQRLRQAELKKAGQGDAKAAEIVAQQAVIQRLERQLSSQTKQNQAAIASAAALVKEANQNYVRRAELVDRGALAKADLDALQRSQATANAALQERQADLEETTTTTLAEIDEAKAKLAELQEVRPIDVEISQAKLDQANVALEQRQADLADVEVRAPIAGQILRINTRIGEQVNTAQGIVELAQTDRMFVIAEVAESDIGLIKPGQAATIVTDYGGFAGEVKGLVAQVSLQIGKRSLQDSKGNALLLDNNARIVEVKIRVDPSDNDQVRAFTGMQVRVRINVQA